MKNSYLEQKALLQVQRSRSVGATRNSRCFSASWSQRVSHVIFQAGNDHTIQVVHGTLL